MPTPRQHGGAALQHIPMVTPAFRGLNKQTSAAILTPEWATTLDEAVLDTQGRVAARKGYDQVAAADTTMVGADIKELHEFKTYAGAAQLVVCADISSTREYRSSSDGGETWTDITGTITSTTDSPQLLTFADNCISVTEDGVLNAIWDGTASPFADLVDGTSPGAEPTGSVGLSAFGRLWITDANDQVIQYCALLDPVDWAGSDAGSIDMRNVWPDGDKIIALGTFNGNLVVFGQRNITIYGDGQGSVFGVDPTQLYVVDTINGVGCYAKHSVETVQGDLWFLSEVGVQSLGRLIQEKSNPINNLTRNIQDHLRGLMERSSPSDIKAVYSPTERFYLLSLSVNEGGVEAGRSIILDTRAYLQDGAARIVGEWSMVPRAPIRLEDESLLMGALDDPGTVGRYDGYTDPDGSSYIFRWESGWLDIQQGGGFLLFPKRLTGLFYVASTAEVTFKIAYDFVTTFSTYSRTLQAFGGGGEWGTAQFNLDEFAGGTALKEGRVSPFGSGEYIKLGTQILVTGELAVQQFDIFAKIGRYK